MKIVSHEYESGYNVYLWPVINLYKDGEYKSVSLKFWKWSWIWSND